MKTVPPIEAIMPQSCADCGADDPRVLEFDDVGLELDSYLAIRQLLDQTWVATDVTEAGEVVCANCHRLRVARRQDLMRRLLGRLP
jgi:hypothetical protein